MEHRCKKIVIDPALIGAFLRHAGDAGWTPHLRLEGIPDDTYPIDMRVENGQLVLLVSSAKFDVVEESEAIPDLLPTIHAWTCHELAELQAEQDD